MLKQVWLFSSLGMVNACLRREHIAKVWTIFQWDQSSLNLHDAKRLGRRVESSVNRPAVLSLCIPPPNPICVTVQRQVSDCLAGAKETPSELTAFPNDKFSFHFLHSLHRGSYSLKFFVISFRQWLLKKDKSATLWWAITHASVSSSPWRLHGNCTQKLMQRGSLKYPKGHSLSATSTLSILSKIITPDLTDSFAFICNVKYLINKLNILQVHENDDNLWRVFCHLSGIGLIRADRQI